MSTKKLTITLDPNHTTASVSLGVKADFCVVTPTGASIAEVAGFSTFSYTSSGVTYVGVSTTAQVSGTRTIAVDVMYREV